MTFTITQSLLICIFVKCFLHAVFTVLLGFALCMTIRNKRNLRNWIGVGVLVIMYFINTAHIGMMMHQDIRDFGGGGAGKLSSARTFAVFGLIQITLQTVAYLLADILLLWRAYVIFEGSLRVIALPAILVLGMTVTCLLWLGHYFEPMYTIEGNDLTELLPRLRSFEIRRFHLASVVMSALANFTLTAMIAGKLFFQQWSMRKHFGYTTLMFESLVIVESGAIYTIGWFMYIFTYALKHNASAIIMDSMSELAGIVPVLIIVAIVLGLSPASAYSASRTALAFAPRPKAAVDSQATLDALDSESGPDKTPPTPTEDVSKEC